jgi:hypothetical protein
LHGLLFCLRTLVILFDIWYNQARISVFYAPGPKKIWRPPPPYLFVFSYV